jgi:hypothetical protein
MWMDFKRRIEMKRISTAVVLALVLLLGTAVVASAITNGQPDGDDHPYVGLLIFDVHVPGVGTFPAWRCSGALIAPDVVLTAGHCTDGAVAARIWMDEGPIEWGNWDPGSSPVCGAATGYPCVGDAEGTPFTNPDFCIGCGPGLPGFALRDVGIVVLDEPIDVDRYAVLPEAGVVDSLKNKTDLDLVGYGVQYQLQIPGKYLPQPPPYYRWAGPRHRLFAPSELISGKFVHSEEFIRISLNPGGGKGGMCFGDSGGPDLLAGTDIALAVNSYGANVNCAGVGYSARVDVPEVLDWIADFLP